MDRDMPRAQLPQPSRADAPRTVLVVEAQPRTARMLARYLQRHGLNVSVVCASAHTRPND